MRRAISTQAQKVISAAAAAAEEQELKPKKLKRRKSKRKVTSLKKSEDSGSKRAAEAENDDPPPPPMKQAKTANKQVEPAKASEPSEPSKTAEPSEPSKPAESSEPTTKEDRGHQTSCCMLFPVVPCSCLCGIVVLTSCKMYLFLSHLRHIPKICVPECSVYRCVKQYIIFIIVHWCLIAVLCLHLSGREPKKYSYVGL